MSGIIGRLRLLTLTASPALLFAATGCASVGQYFQPRYRDFTRMIDLGITVSKKPQIGLYWNSLEIITAGYSNVDGYFIGWGGGQIGVTRMYNHCWALAYGEETIGGARCWIPTAGKKRSCGGVPASSASQAMLLALILPETVTATDPITRPPACISSRTSGISASHGTPVTRKSSAVFRGWFGLDITGPDGDRHPGPVIVPVAQGRFVRVRSSSKETVFEGQGR